MEVTFGRGYSMAANKPTKSDVEDHIFGATDKIRRSPHVHNADLQTADRAVDDDSQWDENTAGIDVDTCSQAIDPDINDR